MMRLFPLCAVISLVSGLLFPTLMLGHGVEVHDVTDRAEASVRSVQFGYSTGEPMMYAQVRLYAPSQPDMEVMQGTSDRNGLFCFIPDEAGEWRIEAEDGMGHKGTVAINVANDTVSDLSAGEISDGKIPRSFAVITGLSLILNFFAVWHFAGVMKKGGSDAHQ